MTRKMGETDSKSQVERFREAAKALETDDREEAFDEIVKRVSIRVSEKAKPNQDASIDGGDDSA